VVDKWLAGAVHQPPPDTLATVKAADRPPGLRHCTTRTRSTRCCAPSAGNLVRFHTADGGGYAFVADRLRICTTATRRLPRAWRAASTAGRSSTPNASATLAAALERIRDHAGLSRDVLEVVTRALG
jgi:aminopeptidase N